MENNFKNNNFGKPNNFRSENNTETATTTTGSHKVFNFVNSTTGKALGAIIGTTLLAYTGYKAYKYFKKAEIKDAAPEEKDSKE